MSSRRTKASKGGNQCLAVRGAGLHRGPRLTPAVLPLNNFLRVSAALMIVHQFVAFALYVTPLIFMFERIWGSHNARWFIRMPLRLPIGAPCPKSTRKLAWVHA